MKSILLLTLLLILYAVVDGRRGGGGGRGGGSRGGSWGSRSSSSSWGSRSSNSRSSSSSWFGSRSSRSSTSSRGSSYGTGSSSSYPKQKWSSSGSKYSQPRAPIGGGGFVNPKVTSYGSSYGAKNTYSYKSPGYGTNYGTSFPKGVGKYGGNGFSKKALGLGVGAGFLGGAALGAAGTIATMGVYHRYMQYRLLYGGLGYNPWYYNNYYYNNHCWGGCPPFSHCEWGFCECDRGFYKRWGRCASDYDSISPRPSNFDPFVACGDNGDCQKIDNNMICNTNVTIQQGGKCECRQDMRWNTNDQECQLFLDVDCSAVTYDKKPSPIVLAAVNKTLEKVEGKNLTAEFTDDGTKLVNETVAPAPNVTLENSLLSSIDPKVASKDEITEAFCRDVDSFSWEFGNPQRLTSTSGSGTRVGRIVVCFMVMFFTKFIGTS